MCTDKTLNDKIRRFNKLSADIKALETEKKALQAAIIAEYDSRTIDNFNGMKLISTAKETIKKSDCPAAIWEHFKSVSEYRYLKQCKTN